MKNQTQHTLTRSIGQSTLKAIAWLSVAPFLHGAAAQAQKIKLAEGTRLSVENVEQLSSNKSRTGQEVLYRVREDVLGENKVVLIRRGAKAFGKIVLAKGAGGLGRKGKLDFNIERVQAVDGSMVQLRSSQKADGKNRKGSMVALTLLVSPLGLFMKGKNAVIQPATQFEAFVDESADIDLSATDKGSDAATTPAVNADTNDAPSSITPPADARAHRVTLKGGRSEKGVITGVSKDKLALVTELGTLNIDTDKIESVESMDGGEAQSMTVSLRSGKTVSATLLGFKDGKWSVETANGPASVSHENLVSMSMSSTTRELE